MFIFIQFFIVPCSISLFKLQVKNYRVEKNQRHGGCYLTARTGVPIIRAGETGVRIQCKRDSGRRRMDFLSWVPSLPVLGEKEIGGLAVLIQGEIDFFRFCNGNQEMSLIWRRLKYNIKLT